MYDINTLDECNGRMEVELSQAAWESGNGPLSDDDCESLGLTLLDPGPTGCESHPHRLGLYQASDGSLWLANHSEVDRSLSLIAYSATEYLREIGGDDAVEAACLIALGGAATK